MSVLQVCGVCTPGIDSYAHLSSVFESPSLSHKKRLSFVLCYVYVPTHMYTLHTLPTRYTHVVSHHSIGGYANGRLHTVNSC